MRAENESIGVRRQADGALKPVSEAHLVNVANDLNESTSRIGTMNDRLAMLIEKVYGPQPKDESKSTPRAVRSGALGQLTDVSDELRSRLIEMNDLISHLERLV